MAEVIPDYDELKLRIEKGRGKSYRVLAFGPDGGTSLGAFRAPFDELELENFILRVGLPRRAVRGFSSSQMEEAKRFGGQLFESIIRGDVAEAYDGARSAATQHDRGLRVTLQLSDAPELMEIPWEFLYEAPNFLSQSIYTPIVRSLDLKHGRPPRKVTLPLRILAVISSPDGYPPLDVDGEREKLDEALRTLREQGIVELTWLETATMAELNRVIGAPDEVHVLHYIGHGAYDERSESGILVLEDEHGHARQVTGEELSALLIDERSLRLAVLNSCEGARTSHLDPFSGVASSLVRCGIEAVVGMQFEITDTAAIAFSERLYTTLSQGFAIDAALAQGRRAIFAAGNDIEFATPVLFLRGADARLFDVETRFTRVTELGPPAPTPARKPIAPLAWARRHLRDRKALLAAGTLLAALIVVIVVLATSGGRGAKPSGQRAQLRSFISSIDAVLGRSRPYFEEVNRVFRAIQLGGQGGAASMTLTEANRSLDDVVSNRNDLAADTRNIPAPTALARKTRRALAAAFDRSVENDRAIRDCLKANSAGIVRNGAKCLKSTITSSVAATDAKSEFRVDYNRLRTNIGLPEKSPSF